MSDGGSRPGSGKDKDEEEEEEAQEYEPPISAIPPKVILQEEGQVEVSASPAFQCLDDLFQAGKLTGTKVALLKAKYTQLHETLKHIRDNETKYLQDAKQYSAELVRQKEELEKGDSFPDGSTTETSKLRTELLKHHNELAQTDERQYQLDYKIECLLEEKKLIDREYSRMPKAGEFIATHFNEDGEQELSLHEEIEKKIKDLQAICDEMRKEIGQRQAEKRNLREDHEARKRQIQIDGKEYEQLQRRMEELKGDLVAVNQMPGQIAKEADKFSRQKTEIEKQKKVMDGEFKELVANLKNLEEKHRSLVEDKFSADNELDKQRSIGLEREREYDLLMKEYEYAKEKEAVLMGDKATLDLQLRHLHLEKKTQHDLHTRKVREKDRDLRSLKKVELHTKVADDNLAHIRTIYDKVKSQVDAQPKDDGSLLAKRQELQREVEQTKRALAQQNSLTAVEQVKVEQSIAEEERLLYDQSDLRIEVVELTRLAAIKADEREQKARDFMRAEQRYHRAVEDLKTKQLQIQDNQKKFQEMQLKLKEFAKLYDVIKNERNKCVNLIQTSTQKAAEMREKIKILQNEIEILRTAVTHKERQLQKQRLKHVNSIVIRDSLRNELAKQHRIDDEMKEKREQQRMDIAKLNLMINQSEEQMMQLRKRYEGAVQSRNDRGIQLIERNEEVCIFYEKVNIQDTMVRNGDVELQGREEEIRFLKMQLQEEKRSIDVIRKQLPNKKSLDQELVTLQIQLSQCQDRMLELERMLENPMDETRVRFLEGKDLAPAQLSGKVEQLEVRLAEKEESLLEKDLIFEQVARLSERVRKKADAGKGDTLSLAKKVNELQAKIKETTRKMMALVSELSMQQASAMKLQQEVKEREADLEQCYMRMEKGEAPSGDMEREWTRIVRDAERRSKERDEATMMAEEAEQYTVAGGITTTADPRPNAYIPDDDTELPIPRPYGSHAPFKPTEAGSTMRHIRKPVPKPIEI